ncbi:uncharacterized protein LOC117584314 isoform X3 [Drosophila guanche]|uniref:uncharacterized protein LOC117584314 isoform X3 n=1 Tax=Drosophila guanche TaxID=7266 RepID=UPI0014726AED|nr:uncharacterized protein LOC117584314 isoform X3 [Drosophila guanche]
MRIVYCNALFALLLLQASVIIDARDCLLCHILQSGKDRRAIIPRISTNVSINGGVHIYGGFGLGSQSSDQPKANQPAREIQHESSQRTAQRSLQVEAKIEIRQFTEADIEIDGKLKTVELIKKYGFPVETHFVTTEDGYKLCLHRMPRPGAQPILLVHGLMSSSAAWVMLGPSNGLAYILYLQGYDVWMLNTRGNIYSMEHTKKFISMREYWDFSFHDIGVKDLPPTIDLILERTNYQQIQYIGHSQGSTVFFVMCSELPSYSSKVIIMQALSPSVFMKETRSPVLQFMSFFKGPLTVLLQQLGGYAVSLTTKLIDKFKHHICPANRITSKICGMFDYVLCGFNWHGFNMTIAPIILGHSSQGSSTKLIHHYAQMHTKLTLHFRRYDYGSTSNLMHYKSISPPSYNLSQTQCKVVLHHGEGDWLSSGSDVAKLQESLPNCIENRKVELKSFSHFDFIMSNDVRSLVYDRVVNVVVTNKIQRTEPLTLTQKTQKWSQVQSQKRISYQSDKSQNTQRYPDSDTPVQHMIHIKRQGALQLGRNLNKQIQYQRQTQIEISKGSDNPSENIPQSPGQALPVQPFLNPDDSVQNSIHIKRQGELQLGTNLNKQIQYQRQTQLEISKGYNNPSENIPQSPGQALPVQPFLSPDDSVQNSIHIKRQGELQLGTSNKQIQYQRQTQLEISNGSNNPSQNIPQWSQVQSDNQISFDGDKAQNPQGYPESDTSVQHTIHIKRQGELQLGTSNKQIQYQRQTQLEISKGSNNPSENIPQSQGQALPVQPFLSPDDSVQNSIHIKRQGELQLGTSNKQIQYQRQTQLNISGDSSYNPTIQSQNRPQWSQVQSDNRISFVGDKAQNPQGYPESDTSVQHTIHIKRQGELQLGTSNKQIQYQRQTQLEISKGSNNPSENIPQSPGQALPVQPFLSPDDSVQNSIHIKRQGELQLGTSNKQIQYQRQTQLNISGDSSYNPTIQSQNRPQWSQVQSDNRISFVGDKAQNPQGYPESDTSVQHTIHIKRQGELQLGTSNKQIQYQRQTQLEISKGSNNPSENIPQSQGQALPVQPFLSPDDSVQNSIHIKRQGELQLGTSNKQIQYQRQTQLNISGDSSYNPVIEIQNIPQWSQVQFQDIQPNRNSDNSVQNSIRMEKQIQINHFTDTDIESNGQLKTDELIRKYGFPVETHFVTTEDGYKLCLHRMPRPGAQPILLVHGLMSSSAAWVMLGPSNGLAYILYLQGYDVWMLNTRGNIYSREHTKKFISMKEYWDFSFHEIGVKDLPPSIDFILERTNYQKIQYIGHSQGSTVFFVMCSELPSYSIKVNIMQALSPSVFMKETRSPVLKFMSFFRGPLSTLLVKLGGYAVSLTTKLIQQFRHHICPANRITSKICGMFDFVLCGFNWHGFNMTLTPIIVGHSSQGSSTKQIHHYAQLQKKLSFHRYDFGPTRNLIHYKSLFPPSYNLSQTQCKVVLHHGEDDWLASGSDVANLQESLPNCIENRKVELKSFSHFDFIMSNDVRSLVYDRVVNLAVTNN